MLPGFPNLFKWKHLFHSYDDMTWWQKLTQNKNIYHVMFGWQKESEYHVQEIMLIKSLHK
jgi:hypothetical protein